MHALLLFVYLIEQVEFSRLLADVSLAILSQWTATTPGTSCPVSSLPLKMWNQTS